MFSMAAVLQQNAALVASTIEAAELREWRSAAVERIKQLEAQVASCNCKAPEVAQEGPTE